jgi:solute:Na+ symporter, SSS family
MRKHLIMIHSRGTLWPGCDLAADAIPFFTLSSMALFDWLILAVYCASVLGLAMFFRARAGENIENFFVAGRNLPWWVIGFADVAGYTGGGQGFVMVVFLSGYSGLWLMAWLSWVIWMPLVAILWAPMWRRLGVMTTGEFIERRYAGRRAAVYRNVYALYACFVWGMTSIAYVSAWMATTTGPILGWSTPRVLLVFGALTLTYSMVAGLLAVAYNDVFQFLILMGGNLVFGCLLVSRAGGMEHVWARIAVVRGGHFLASSPFAGSITLMSALALCVQGLFFAGSPFAGEGWTAQRFMAARNEWHAIAGQIANGVLALVIRVVPFILIALAAAALYPVSSVAVPAALWGELVQKYAPPGLLGLLLVSSLAGYMAAISSIGNWASSYLINDVYQRTVRPQAGQSELVMVSRVVTVVLLGASFLCGAFIDPASLGKWVLFINSSLVVFSLPLAWLKWFWWRTNAVGDMVGILGAFPAGFLVWFGSDSVLPAALRGWVRGTLGFNCDQLIPAFSNLDVHPFWQGFVILFGLGWIAILVTTLLSRPEPLETLQKFYLSARPIGFWKPVWQSLGLEAPSSPASETTRDLLVCALGIVFYSSLTISLFSAMGGRLASAVVEFVLAVASGYVFARMAIARTHASQLGNADSVAGRKEIL